MKVIITFFVLLALSFGALGSEMVDKQLAFQFLKISRTEESINITLDTYRQQLFQGIPDADRAELDKLLQQVVGWDAIKDQLADLVVQVYTKKELKAAIAFMKSPLGASFTKKGDLFSAKFSTVLSHNLQKFMQEYPIQPKPAAKGNVPEAAHPSP